jgi:putative heme iron utilization protein
VEGHGDVVGQLAPHGQDYSLWVLHLIDVHNNLEEGRRQWSYMFMHNTMH